MPEETVHTELRVPFQADAFHAEAWLRAERPGLNRLASLVDAQPPMYRPQLRRLIREAAQSIVDAPAMSAADIEAKNHATHLLADEAEVGLFSTRDVIPVDPQAEKDQQIAAAQAAQAEAEAEVARLQALLADTPTDDPADGDEGIAQGSAVEVTLDPGEPGGDERVVVTEHDAETKTFTAEEVAASAAILDAALEGDLDDDEVAPYTGGADVDDEE